MVDVRVADGIFRNENVKNTGLRKLTRIKSNRYNSILRLLQTENWQNDSQISLTYYPN